MAYIKDHIKAVSQRRLKISMRVTFNPQQTAVFFQVKYNTTTEQTTVPCSLSDHNTQRTAAILNSTERKSQNSF